MTPGAAASDNGGLIVGPDRLGSARRRAWRAARLWLMRRFTRLVRRGAAPPAGGFVVLARVHGGEPHLAEFLRYHTALGAAHVYLLHNGPPSSVPALCEQWPHVTLYETRLPFRFFKADMIDFLVSLVAPGHWALVADVDEFLYVPTLWDGDPAALLRYCDRHGYTAVVGYQVDMFGRLPLEDVTAEHDRDLHGQFAWCDLACVRDLPYPAGELSCTNDLRVPAKVGGVREPIFGCVPNLTKICFLKNDGAAFLVNGGHAAARSRLADTTVALKHYHFTSGFRDKCRQAVERRQYYEQSIKYRLYLDTLNARPSVSLWSETAHPFSEDYLIASGVLMASERARTRP